MSYEVPQPILNSPYEEPRWHWFIEEGKPCQRREGRRPSVYYYRPPRSAARIARLRVHAACDNEEDPSRDLEYKQRTHTERSHAWN